MTKHIIKLNGSFLRSDNALVSDKRFARRFDDPLSAYDFVKEKYPICFETGMFLILPVEK